MKASFILGGRAVREALRTLDSLLPTMFIPLFFLVVNIGQASKQFNGSPWLFGQEYAAFQLPSSLLLAASFGSAALYLTEEIEGGYFDKLRATPISRMSLVLGRLYAEMLKSAVITALMIVIGFVFGVRVKSGILGCLMLMVICGLWAVVFSGFMQLVSMKTRSAAATQGASMVFFPLLFVTPNFLPLKELSRPMEIAARINPVTYIMEATRSLILEGFRWATLGKGFLVIAIAMALMLALSVRMVNAYD
jgi:ABC-2 type transport system permease protein